VIGTYVERGKKQENIKKGAKALWLSKKARDLNYRLSTVHIVRGNKKDATRERPGGIIQTGYDFGRTCRLIRTQWNRSKVKENRRRCKTFPPHRYDERTSTLLKNIRHDRSLQKRGGGRER